MGPAPKKTSPGSSGANDQYVWEPPNRQIQITIRLDLIENINRWISDAAEREGEAGGLLLGEAESTDSAAPRTFIHDFEPLPITHYRGPSFTLTQKDRNRLQRRMQIWNDQRGSTLKVVGLVRSHLRRGLYLDVADTGVFKDHFHDPYSVFLLVRPGPSPTGGFFFWEGDDIHVQSSYKPFPFDAHSLGSGLVDVRGPAQVLHLPPQPLAGPPVAVLSDGTPEPDVSRRRRSLIVPVRLLWTGAAALTFVLAAGFFTGALMNSAAGSDGLGLTIMPSHTQAVRIAWNPKSRVIAKGNQGMLRIEDGQRRQTVDLSHEDLLRGGALYTPASSDVSFVLEVRDKARSTSESIHAVLRRPEPLVIKAPTARTENEGSSDRGTPRPSAADRSLQTAARSRSLGLLQRVSFTPAKAPNHTAPSNRKGTHFVAPTMTHAGAAQQRGSTLDLLEPTSPYVGTAHPVAVSWALPKAPAPESMFAVDLAPAPESKVRTVMSSVTGIRFLKRLGGDATTDYLPPYLIHETRPDAPETVGVSLQTDVRLNFRVSVDKAGRVDDVELLSAETDHRLVGLADAAIRQWMFEPARIRRRAVSSKLIASVCFLSPYSRPVEHIASSGAGLRSTP